MVWKEAIYQPGAQQMIYGRRLIESRPFLSRIPAPDLIVESIVPTSIPGAGRYRFAATRDQDASFAMIYVPTGRRFSIHTAKLKAKKIKAWWYNPRNGKAEIIGTLQNKDSMEFISPTPGENIDWILVLDDADKKYPAPGKHMSFRKK